MMPLSGGEFIRDDQHAFQFFEAGEVLVDALDDFFVQRLYLGIGDQFGARGEPNVVSACPVFQQSEVGRNHHRWKFTPFAEDGGDSHEGIQLQGIFDGLGRDKFSAGSFDEIFLAVGDRQVAVGIDVADVPSLEPAVYQSGFRFFRTVPVAFENRGPAHQNFAVFGNADFNVGQSFADGSDAVIDRRVDRDDRARSP